MRHVRNHLQSINKDENSNFALVWIVIWDFSYPFILTLNQLHGAYLTKFALIPSVYFISYKGVCIEDNSIHIMSSVSRQTLFSREPFIRAWSTEWSMDKLPTVMQMLFADNQYAHKGMKLHRMSPISPFAGLQLRPLIMYGSRSLSSQ